MSALSHWRRLPPASIHFRSRLSWAEPSLEVTSAWPRPSIPFWPLPVSGRTPSCAAPPFPPPRADRRAPRRRFRCGPRPGCGPRLRTSPRLCCSAGPVACSTAGGPAAPRIGKPCGPGFLSRGGSGRCSRWRGGGVKARQVCRDRREDAGRRSAGCGGKVRALGEDRRRPAPLRVIGDKGMGQIRSTRELRRRDRWGWGDQRGASGLAARAW